MSGSSQVKKKSGHPMYSIFAFDFKASNQNMYVMLILFLFISLHINSCSYENIYFPAELHPV